MYREWGYFRPVSVSAQNEFVAQSDTKLEVENPTLIASFVVILFSIYRMNLFMSDIIKRGIRMPMAGRHICQKLFESKLSCGTQRKSCEDIQKVRVLVHRPHGAEVHSLWRVDR
jgi:hypothetical protein